MPTKEIGVENAEQFESMGMDELENAEVTHPLTPSQEGEKGEQEEAVAADKEKAESKAEEERSAVSGQEDAEVSASKEKAEGEEDKWAEKKAKYGAKPEDWDGSEKSYYRFRDLQTELTQKSQAYRTLESQSRQQEFEIEKLKRTQAADDFEVLSSDLEKALKDEDPEAYGEYLERKIVWNENQLEIQGREATLAASRTDDNTLAAVKTLAEQLNWKVAIDETKPLKQQAELVQFLVKDEGFLKTADFFRDNCPWKPQDNGVYSTKQIMDAYFLINKDTILAKQRVRAAAELKNNVSSARNGGSVLDRAAKTDKTDPARFKKYEGMSQRDFEEMSIDEIEAAEKELLK